MAKKPHVTPAPTHLEAGGKAFWTETQSTYGINDQAGQRLLQAACECLDSAERARLAVEKFGQVFTDRLGNVRPRPETKLHRDALLAFKALLRELRLDPIPQQGAK